MGKTGLWMIIVCWMLSLAGNAQTTEYVGARQFVLHTVQKKETLYGISQKYDVPVDTIIAYNPGSESVIKVDQVLRFPNGVLAAGEADVPEVNLTDKVLYKVQKGETLYSISRKFNTTVEYLLALNPQIGDVLQADQNIFVPKQAVVPSDTATAIHVPVVRDTFVTATCDSSGYMESTIDIALLLPFYGGINSKVAAEFYAGAKVAADSLAEKIGKKIVLHVYDTKGKNDTDRVLEILQLEEMKDMELLIGPLYASNMLQGASYLNTLKLPMVAPFAKTDALLENNPYIFKVLPDEKTSAREMVAYFHRAYPGAKYILANPGRSADSLTHVYYKDALKEFAGTDTVNYVFLSSRSGVSGNISPGRMNVVIYPCSREITVKDFLTKFNKSVKETEVILVGTEDWLNFSNIEADYYENLHLHVPVCDYESYTDSTNLSFIKGYQEQFGTDPSIYSFRAYRVMDYFTRALTYYGAGLDNCEKINFNCRCEVPMIFKRPDPAGGLENHAVRMMIFENYSYRYLTILNP